jgi:hypothetical protein
MLALTGHLWAMSEAIFTSVSGKVEIRGHKGHKLRLAQKDATLAEGERVVAGPNAQATLQAFDGSILTISPNTDFWLEKLEQPKPDEKILQFKLELGKLLAKVTKLISARSTFEISAGGVVCGVRGTEYSMAYDPSTGKVDLQVLDGTVWTTSGGQTREFHAGQGGTFLNGQWDHHPSPPPSTGNPRPGFISSNPFYGFNATGADELNNHLTDLPGGVKGVTGQVGTVGIAGSEAHNTLILQLGFPQYVP